MTDAHASRVEAVLLDLFRRSVKPSLAGRVRGEARLQADLELDSLGVLSTLLAAEGDLGITVFPLPPDVGEIRTVGEVIAIIAAQAQRGESG